MFQGSSSPASFSFFSILSAIRFYLMAYLIRGVLRGENKAVGINRIKNTRFPEMHINSILLISMASSGMPLEFDSGKLKNPECSTEMPTPSGKKYRKAITSAENKLGSRNHPLKKLGSCNVGLGIILGSPFDSILFTQQVKGYFPKPSGSSPVQATTPTNHEVGAHEYFNSSSVNTNNVGMTNNTTSEFVPVESGRSSNNIHHDWPCLFALNQGLDSVTRGSQQLTICTKHRTAGFLSLEDIETTDNYTRIINYLPCLKVTHMYNNCILEFPQRQSSDGDFSNKNPVYPPRVHNLRRWSILSSNENFLKNCEACDKPLEGRDVYIYRGESSFCSLECRYWRVQAKRDFEKVTRMLPMAPSPSNNKPIFYMGSKPPASA